MKIDRNTTYGYVVTYHVYSMCVDKVKIYRSASKDFITIFDLYVKLREDCYVSCADNP